MTFKQKSFKSLLQSTGWIFIWFFLCGIERSGKQNNFAISDLQTANMFQSMPSLSEIPISFYFLVVFGIGAVVGSIRLSKYLREKQAQEELDQIVDDQAQLGLDSELESKQVDEEDREFLKVMCNTTNPIELLPVVKTPQNFEAAVNTYKQSEWFNKKGLKGVYALRKSLGYTFKNTDVPFICSQLLEPGTRLECQIHHKERNVLFMSSIIESDETQMLIKPPTVKRRPANLKQFPEVHCKIRRENDADYEFKVKIKGQLVKDINAVVLKHTKNIRKMAIRDSVRVPMDMEMAFELVSEAQYDLEKKFDVGQLNHFELNAKIIDMSAGGMKIQMPEMPPQGINSGDVFLFHLTHASMMGKMVANVMNIVPKGGLYDIHFMFSEVDTLSRMKLNQFLHRASKNMDAA